MSSLVRVSTAMVGPVSDATSFIASCYDSSMPTKLRSPGGRYIAPLGAACAVVSATMMLLPLSIGPRMVLEPLLISRGFGLYTGIVDQHEPLLPYALAILSSIGVAPFTAALLTHALILVLTLLFTFAAAGRIPGSPRWTSFLISAALLPTIVEGKLWYDMAMAPILAAAFCVLIDGWESARERRSMIAAGILLGLCFLVKQHTLFVVAAIILWLFVESGIRRGARRSLTFATGFLLLPAAHISWRFASDSLASYLRWCWLINDTYFDLAALWPTRKQLVELLPVMLLLLLSIRSLRDSRLRLAAMIAVSAATLAFPRYAHFHLAAALPFIALLCGSALTGSLLQRRVVFASACALLALGSAHGWIRARPGWPVIEYDNLKPVAQIVRDRTTPGDNIVVFPEDEATANLYALADRLPADFWMLTYPWYIAPDVEDRMIERLERSNLVVLFPNRDLEGRLPETYMRRTYEALCRSFPVAEKHEWEQGEYEIRMRAASSP